MDLPGPAIGFAMGTGGGVVVVVKFGRFHHHGDPLHLLHLPQLQGGELGPGGPAAADHRHGPRGGGAEAGADVLGNVGGLQLLGGAHEHPRDVQGHVADPHHGGALGGEVPLGVGVGVAVVPGHELGRPVGAGEVLAGDAHRAVREGAGGEDDGVVVATDVLEGDVGAEMHVAEEADARVLADLPQVIGDALDARVVGRDAVAQEAERHGQRVEQVHHHLLLVLVGPGQQGVAGEHSGRARTDHGDAERGS